MNQNVAPSAEDQFDEETSRQIEAVYLTPDVANQRDKVVAMLAPRAGENALDIGCGPGLTTQALAQQMQQPWTLKSLAPPLTTPPPPWAAAAVGVAAGGVA